MKALQQELETYRREYQRLRPNAGKYVSIFEDQVLGVWDSFEEAVETGMIACRESPFLVKRIEPFPPRSAGLGACLLALGITLLLAGVTCFQVGYEKQFGFVCCMWIGPVCSIVLGILLIRRAEDQDDHSQIDSPFVQTQADAESNEEAREVMETFDQMTSLIVPQLPLPLPRMTNPRVEGTLERVRQFDLNRMNWGGWLLFTLTIVFLAVEIRVIVGILEEFGVFGVGAISGLITAALLLPIGFFVGTRRLLKSIGISLFRW